MDTCIVDMEVEKEVVVTFAWVKRPERPMDEVGPPAGTRAPRLLVRCIFFVNVNFDIH